jgi:Tfp pilus assembly protein PilF
MFTHAEERSTNVGGKLEKKIKRERAKCFASLKNFTRAEEDFEAALKLDQEADLYNALGECLVEKGNYYKGMRKFKSAVEQHEKDLGKVAHEKGAKAKHNAKLCT